MTLRDFVPNHLVVYDSVRAGLPNAHHERHFRLVDGALRETMLNLERVLAS